MKISLSRALPLAMAITLACGAAHADTKDVFGTWLTPAGSAHVAIEDCGDGGPCGRVAWMNPASMREGLTPEAAVDENNPDPARRNDPVLGLLMLSDFDEKRNDWRGGKIYDPETGRTYGSRLKRLDDGTLQVKGCIGPICQTQVWTPVEDTPS
ncbi:MAG: DUF2147 domain-containing protein [Pseudomonadota bacterium]